MENRLEHLNQVNDVPVHSVLDPEFASYGRVVTGYDFSEMIAYMEQNTPIPENGNIYVASVPEMEALAVSAEVQKKFYGDMPIEVGYCNGRNTTWNGFEYHKGSEMTRLVAKIVQVRYTYLAPVIIMFCFAGAFAATGNTKELIICAGILIFSYILTVLDIDNTPLMLGMILEDIMEQNFVTASMSYDRNYSIFITRPISAVILIITVVLLVSMIRVNRRVAKLNEQQEAEMAAEHAKMENA